jgi:hypothetical protein
MRPSELFLGGKRVGYGSKLIPYQVEGVKWLFQDFTGIITGLGDVAPTWDFPTKTLTAGSNVALPTVQMYPGGIPKVGLIADRLYGFVQADITAGAQVGDTLLLINDNYGYHGLYQILNKGVNGVTPFSLLWLGDEQDIGEVFEVRFPVPVAGPAEEHSTLTIRLSNDYFEPDLSYWYSMYRAWWSDYGMAFGYGAKAVDGVAIGNLAWSQRGIAAIGQNCYNNDPGIVAISSNEYDYSQGGAYVRKFRLNIAATSYNIARRDEGAIIRCTSNSAVTCTVRTTATINSWFLGAQLEILQAGAGLVTAAAAVGVIITGPVTTDGPGSRLLLFCVAENVWESTRVSAKTFTVGTTAGTVAAADDPRFAASMIYLSSFFT